MEIRNQEAFPNCWDQRSQRSSSRFVQARPTGRVETANEKRGIYVQSPTNYHARLVFKARCRMLNLRNNFRNGKTSILCELCGEETEDHIIDRCVELQALRNEGSFSRDELFDPSDLQQLVEWENLRTSWCMWRIN